jgi:predicted Zn-dependent protease
MNRFAVRLTLFALPALFAAQTWAQESPAPTMEKAAHKEALPANPRPAKPSAATVVPMTPHMLFGALPVATKSDEARKLLEKSIDLYENVLLDESIASAKQATVRDPHFALAYAIWAYAADRTQPVPEAVKKAKALAVNAPEEEQLLIGWLADIEEGNNLAAINAMNDLLVRFPTNTHVLYLTSEWLYFQQDYRRSQAGMRRILDIDPNFPPALNMLGYSYVEGSDPNPEKAVNLLNRYAALKPTDPNPQDSLGEISRYIGDDQASIEHYSAAIKISSTYFTSKVGLADTRTLMGDYAGARTQYDKAIASATNTRDRLATQFQKALVNYWEGQPEQGRKALTTILEQARRQKEPYAEFEAALALAQLNNNYASSMEVLHSTETLLSKPVVNMSEPDRNAYLGVTLREEARLSAMNSKPEAAQEAISKLERYAAITQDLVIENNYESARGFALFAQGDYANAADELETDPHSPIATLHLALALEKLGNKTAAEEARTRLRFQRAPTPEWFFVAHASATSTTPTSTASTSDNQ